MIAFERATPSQFVDWCKHWVNNTYVALKADASLLVWMGADQDDGFQPLPEFMILMRATRFEAAVSVTMRIRSVATALKRIG